MFSDSIDKHNRCKTDIIAAILSAVNDRPLGKTKIVYSAFLSSVQKGEYLSDLVTKGLLSYNKVTKTFQTTEQGKEFLRLYEKMKMLNK